MTRQGGNVYVNMNKTYHASPASLSSARSYIIYRLPKIREDVLFRILRWEYREPTEIDKAVEFVSLEQGIAKEDLTVASGQYLDFPRTGRKIWKGIITDRKTGAEFIIYLDEALAQANITEVTSKEAERGKFEKLDSRSFELIWNAGPDDEFELIVVPRNLVENNISAYLASKGYRWNYNNFTARLPKRIIQELSSNDEIDSIKVRKP
ncbi:Uncharacterised protein [uncultured archaeon]|nr:Uncharacterised protein [uncultured archaeon]